MGVAAQAPWLAGRWTSTQAILASAPPPPLATVSSTVPSTVPASVDAPVAPPAAAPPTLAPVLAATAASSLEPIFTSPPSDEPRAWRALAGLWGVVLGAGDPCVAALSQSLQCYRGRGGLAPIRLVDRPVLLQLADERGRSVHAVKVALAGDSATARVGNVDHVLPLAALARVWRGEFATLWRAPPGFRDGALVGVDSPLGGWLAQKLAAVDGRALPAASAEALTSQVFAFQLAQGLAPDGLAGPLTLMKLNRASGVDEPRLLAAR